MRDYLSELCTKSNIKLIYTEGDFTALSMGIKNNILFIKADRIFKGCPEKVAKAVIDYYTGSQHEYDCLKVLKSYIHDNVVSVEYTIEPPNERLKSINTDSKINTSEDGKATGQITSENGTGEQNIHQCKTTKKGTSIGGTAKKGAAKDNLSIDDLASYVEMEIASIIKSSFWGEASKIRPDEAIKPSNDDVIDLEIEIDDSR